MRRSAWRLLALISLIALAPAAHGETRPRYGGTLTVEIHGALTFTDPADWPPELVPLVYDRLVRMDDRGEARPQLAIFWRPDSENKRWEFRLRPGVKFHDGWPVDAAAVAASLASQGMAAMAGEGTVIVQTENP